MIFTLHRCIGLDETKKQEIFREAEEKLDAIRKEKFRQIAEEIKNVEIYQFLRSITWGYQVREDESLESQIVDLDNSSDPQVFDGWRFFLANNRSLTLISF